MHGLSKLSGEGPAVTAACALAMLLAGCHQGGIAGAGAPCTDHGSCRNGFRCVDLVCQLSDASGGEAADGSAETSLDTTPATPDVDAPTPASDAKTEPDASMQPPDGTPDVSD